ncbi:hypothetical protein HAX54_012014 [Datura stramonium]|uniref:FRIGIDA-like protein n=1 Tax=Datura stramonium TaxID=4076 RepID=A0ABS8TLW4_DATST|nr:hypothetical protein [Datura stramonium]
MAAHTATNPERIHAFFNDLEARQTLLTTITDLHKTLTTHFTNIDKALCQKSETLDTHIKTFKEKTEDALLKLQNRENALPDRESSMAARITEMKEASISEIENAESLGDLSEKSLPEVLRIYCKRMDASGLVRFLQTKRKEPAGLRTEIANALDSSVDPMRFSVALLEAYLIFFPWFLYLFSFLGLDDGKGDKFGQNQSYHCICQSKVETSKPIFYVG